MSSREEDKQYIPDVISDNTTGISYRKGRFFGKGGFAKCYEITDLNTKHVYAGKIVSKKLMLKHNQREKITQEITIHKSLNNKHVVGFHSFFEDSLNVYIVLELCRKRSMMELHKRRKALTEPEVRYYMQQILEGVAYLHKERIIHRDLKLGNLFLDDSLQVKIGDFGLAAKIEFDGERKRTLCGTPNYIAPEILSKKGHSFEVDVWSIGCILFTLLVGKPPFETSSLKETYNRIKKCDYSIPPSCKISAPAFRMIQSTLQIDPRLRPTVHQLLNHEFLTTGLIPPELPVSSLTVAPRFDSYDKNPRKPLLEVNGNSSNISPLGEEVEDAAAAHARENLLKLNAKLQRVVAVIASNAINNVELGDESTDPAAQPLVWISKWVDYSDKYGFGYQLSDDAVGVMFNDRTKIVMLPNGLNVHYIQQNGKESYHTMNEYPGRLDKKMKLLTYFRRYMSEHLVKAGGAVAVRESDALSRTPHLQEWFRTSSAVVMHLTNGTVQINFTDHTKIILCPLMSAVTYIDASRGFRTFRFSTIEQQGCSLQLFNSLKYACDKINMILKSGATCAEQR
ncbi:serine/threonine-protein kinase polo [Bacillus rossius redtenbacheri]|uniref:serine/threonine-protein kinase polo n=1 Tax=Bacillus rossius redtenbacheri TaxID=93214 RepID=UPI002FDD9E49